MSFVFDLIILNERILNYIQRHIRRKKNEMKCMTNYFLNDRPGVASVANCCCCCFLIVVVVLFIVLHCP